MLIGSAGALIRKSAPLEPNETQLLLVAPPASIARACHCHSPFPGETATVRFPPLPGALPVEVVIPVVPLNAESAGFTSTWSWTASPPRSPTCAPSVTVVPWFGTRPPEGIGLTPTVWLMGDDASD